MTAARVDTVPTVCKNAIKAAWTYCDWAARNWRTGKTICFWEKNDDVFYDLEGKGTKYTKLVNFLTPICQLWSDFLDTVHPRIKYVKIDKYDTYSMDSTLVPIILPMLKQLRDTKHGSPMIDMEDVPVEFRTTSYEEYDSQKCFDFYYEVDENVTYKGIHDRWTWVLNEEIFAFERLADDSWRENFQTGKIDFITKPCAWDENGKATMYQSRRGPNYTFECDYDGMIAVEDRIQNGLRLFGKYFNCHWD